MGNKKGVTTNDNATNSKSFKIITAANDPCSSGWCWLFQFYSFFFFFLSSLCCSCTYTVWPWYDLRGLLGVWYQSLIPGSRGSLFVERRPRGPQVEGSNPLQKRQENVLPQSQLCVLTLARCPLKFRVTAVVRKRSRSFCQKWRWQVTPIHAYTHDPTKSEWADSTVQIYCGNLSGKRVHTQLVREHSATVVSDRWTTVDRS